MFGQLIATLKKSPKTIVFTEGTDPRILEASARLLSGNFLKPVLVGNPEEIAVAAEDAGFNIRGAEIADPANYPEMDAMVEQMVELRKGKMTPEQCRDALKKGNYFGTMLVKMGKADALLGGATYSTADTVRPALQLVKTKKGAHLVSSSFILFRKDKDGNFIWPGFGDNMRVLDWIIKRVEGKVDAVETPIGFLPKKGDINLKGIEDEVTSEVEDKLLAVDVDLWKKEIAEMRRYYNDDIKAKGGNIPQALFDELDKIEARLNKA